MKWSQMLMFLPLILAQISIVFGGTTYEIKTLPSVPYLFREINEPIKKDDIKSLQLISHKHVDALAAEVQKSKSKVEPRLFYRIDVVKFRVQDVGQIILQEAQSSPEEKTRVFPGGKYFVINFEGSGSEIDKTFMRIPQMLKEAHVTPESPVITYFKQSAINSPSEKIQILIKLEEKFFVEGCSVFSLDGKLVETFPGNQCLFLEDGRFVSATDEAIRMFSIKNEILWEVKGKFHHQINLSQDRQRVLGMTHSVSNVDGRKTRIESLMLISIDGKILVERKLSDLMAFEKHWPVAPFLKNNEAKIEISHLNSIYEIPENSSPLPYLKKGNIIFNSLHLGAYVLDPDMKKVLKQFFIPNSHAHMVHDVQVTSDGKILYFNNTPKNAVGYSTPEIHDLKTGLTQSLISDAVKKIKSPTCGNVQILDKELLMYSGSHSGPIFIDRKTGDVIKPAEKFSMAHRKGNPTFMIKFVSLSSFFQHRQEPRQ